MDTVQGGTYNILYFRVGEGEIYDGIVYFLCFVTLIFPDIFC